MKSLIFLVILNSHSIFGQNAIIPSVKTAEFSVEEVKLPKSIAVDGEMDDDLIEFFSNLLKDIGDLEYAQEGAYTIRFIQLDSMKYLNPGSGYELIIEPKTCSLGYYNKQGKIAGLMTFLQLITHKDANAYLPKGRIIDFANFEWRGMHLDVSRHFFSVDEVKRMLRLMAFYKFNKFHWHLTDDQGWRIAIDKYPLLTEVGAFRDSTLIGHYSDHPIQYDHRTYGGFYSKDEIREVVAYAGSLGIEVVPEIEMPGHSRAALAAYPQYSCSGEKLPVPGTWGVFSEIYCSKNETIEFLQDVLSEVIELFPSKYLHIGGDEAPKESWKSCAACQDVIRENHLKDEHELQSYFIKQMDDFLSSKGKTLVGWDEILEGGLSPNATVMSWRGVEGGIEAAKQEHQMIMSPTSFCYFDYYQSAGNNEPLAIGGFLPIEKVYQFSSISSNEDLENSIDYMLGGQANLWTEYIPDLNQLEYMTFPRLLALSENLWNQESLTYSEFVQGLVSDHFRILDSLKVNYSKAVMEPIVKLSHVENGLRMQFIGPTSDIDYMVKSSIARDKNEFEMDSMLYNANSYMDLFQTNAPMQIRLDITGEFNGSREIKIELHKGIGAKVDLLTAPHPKYANNASLNLVDGVKGKRPWMGSEWLGFNTPTVEFVIDFEESRLVDSLIIGFLNEEGQWIYLPESLTIFISKNGKRWKSASVINHLKENQHISLSKQTRYIKFKSESIIEIPDGKQGAGNVPWTFIDEIQIY